MESLGLWPGLELAAGWGEDGLQQFDLQTCLTLKQQREDVAWPCGPREGKPGGTKPWMGHRSRVLVSG